MKKLFSVCSARTLLGGMLFLCMGVLVACSPGSSAEILLQENLQEETQKDISHMGTAVSVILDIRKIQESSSITPWNLFLSMGHYYIGAQSVKYPTLTQYVEAAVLPASQVLRWETNVLSIPDNPLYEELEFYFARSITSSLNFIDLLYEGEHRTLKALKEQGPVVLPLLIGGNGKFSLLPMETEEDIKNSSFPNHDTELRVVYLKTINRLGLPDLEPTFERVIDGALSLRYKMANQDLGKFLSQKVGVIKDQYLSLPSEEKLPHFILPSKATNLSLFYEGIQGDGSFYRGQMYSLAHVPLFEGEFLHESSLILVCHKFPSSVKYIWTCRREPLNS